MIGHPSTFGGSIRSDPRTISSIDMGRRPMRFVNHVESGTSSIVLTFRAGPPVRSPGLTKVCSTKSYMLLPSPFGAAPLASNAVSSSIAIGSSGKNFGVTPRPAVASRSTATRVVAEITFMTTRLEDMAVPEDEMISGAAAERALDPEEDPGVAPKTETDPVVRFQIPQRQILGT